MKNLLVQRTKYRKINTLREQKNNTSSSVKSHGATNKVLKKTFYWLHIVYVTVGLLYTLQRLSVRSFLIWITVDDDSASGYEDYAIPVRRNILSKIF